MCTACLPLPTSSLTRPPREKETFLKCYGTAEVGLYKSYSGHLKAAENLSKEGFYKEAWLSLMTSIECFFKDILCLVRFHIWNGLLPQQKPNTLNAVLVRSWLSDNAKSIMKHFGHDLRTLAKVLQEIFSNLSEHFVALASNLPYGGWISERYDAPDENKDKDKYEAKYKTTYACFSEVLNSDFQELK